MAILLSARDVSKKYTLGRTVIQVLRGASVDVAEGESVAIVGASGAGKSTLLHILGGLDRPDQGTIEFESRNLFAQSQGRRTSQRARAIGFVFQSYHLLPELDVLENVTLPARAMSPWTADRKPQERAKDLINAVGLGDRIRHRPMELSGGEQQRVAIARAIMNQPKLILADEPTGNLDERTGGKVLDILFELAKNHRAAMIMVTHSPAMASRCDRVLRLDEGRIVPGA